MNMRNFTKRVMAFEFVSDLLDSILLSEGEVDVLECPVRMGIDGDFYPADFSNATHLLRIALSTEGYEDIHHTHDLAWGQDDYGTLHIVADALNANGFVSLSTDKPFKEGDWAFLVEWEPAEQKAFWREVPQDEYTLWLSRPVQILKFQPDFGGETE